MDLWKAVMAGDVPNAMIKKCADILVPYLGEMYRATFRLDHYPSNWRIYDTIVLRKPGRKDYTKPNSYRPICLLKTIAKPLSIAVTEYLSHLAEKHHMLPDTHFGFRPGRSTTDALLAVDQFIKDAWHDGDVVSGLFLDVKGAFPSVHIPRLVADLRRKGVPAEITRWIVRKLDGRRTTLVFDNYRSRLMAIEAGLDQGCPLSGLLYNFYNAALGELASRIPRRSLIPGFADDIAIFVRGRNFQVVRRDLGYIIRDEDGVLDWADTHNCNYAKDKWALIDFTHRRTPDGLRPLRGGALRIERDITVAPSDSAKYLGVMLHYKLSWTQQWNIAIARGTAWTNAVARMMRSKMGIRLQFARQVYRAVCLPRMLYAAELWATPARRQQPRAPHIPRDRAPSGILAKMASVQRRALLSIAGAMRTTATCVLEAHLNIMPIDLHLDVLRHRALVRHATLPPTHPIHKALRHARSTTRCSHISALTALVRRYRVNPELMEVIDVVRQHPAWTTPFVTHISPDRDDAVVTDAIHTATDDVTVYSDGSAHDGHVGAAAYLVRRDGTTRHLQLYLGRDLHYTVHAAEGVGIVLAAHLIRTETQIPRAVSFGVDNQAIILGCRQYRHGRGQWAIDIFRKKIIDLRRETRASFTVRWTPGHIGIAGNEEADELAKAAADGPTNSSPHADLPPELREPIPRSAAAISQEFVKRTKTRALKRWRQSKQYAKIRLIDKTLPSNAYLKLVKGLMRRQSSLLIRLRTGHSPLNRHLWAIKVVDSPGCDACGRHEEETVRHYLTTCPAHERARATLRSKIGPRNAGDIAALLTQRKLLRLLFKFVDTTRRFRDLLGTVTGDEFNRTIYN
jgi:ribonuclease HI